MSVFAPWPPEVISGMMYSGPGSGPMMAAAAAWDGLAAELGSIVSSYQSVLSGLTGAWQGPAAVSMTGAAETYLSWLMGTAAQAEQAGVQAQAAGTAFETAFAATVPPPVIAANRTLLMALVATNFFGQNTPAIMATEAQYLEMWAQDVAMMISYAMSSAQATIMQVFTAAPQVVSGMVGAVQSAVTQVGAQLGGASNILASLPQLVPTALGQLVAPAAQLLAPAASAAGDPPLGVLSGGLSGILDSVGLSSLAGGLPGLNVSSLFGSFGTEGLLLPLQAGYYGAMMATIPARMFMGMNSAMSGMPGAGMTGTMGETLLNSVGQLVDGKLQTVVGTVAGQLRSWAGAVSAQLGHAASLNGVSQLSVPEAWSTAVGSTMTRAAPVLPNTTVSAPTVAPSAGMPGGPFGQALMGTLSGRGLSSLAAKAPKVVPRSPAGG